MARSKSPPSPHPAAVDRPPLPADADVSHITPDLRALAFPVADLVEDPANSRLHGERNMKAISGSLKRFRQRKPVVVRRDGSLVEAGNGTLAAARALGWTHIAVVFEDDDPVTAAAFAIADNRSAELAEWDLQALGKSLAAIKEQGGDLASELGWDEAEMAHLLSAEWTPPPASDAETFDPADGQKGKTVTFTKEQWAAMEPVLDAYKADNELKGDADALASMVQEFDREG